MQTNNQKKLKYIIFIIWGLFISGVILVFLIILLLAMNKPQTKTDNQNKPTLTSKANLQQEQETYNAILRKIESEFDELTTEKEIVHHPGSKNIKHIKIFNSQTKKEIKRINYVIGDGKTVKQVWEINPEGVVIKSTHYQDDGKTINWIREINPDGKPTKITYYNKDGTIKETKTF
uniref:DUF2963 domain-containing protein n=1 Tax='Brassica napus' phytoplasma TaxID=469009 RepID=G9BMN9_9MOLU|nr:DUF2963 domain-containing protein ['Brassica napus' phytoplasma]AEB00652.1 hypothetical protein ['Brassica napus' phytoplasma]